MNRLSRQELKEILPVNRLSRDLAKQWEDFVNGNMVLESQSHYPILESWLRCKERRVDPYLERSPIVLPEDGIFKLCEDSDLFKGAKPIMDEIAPLMTEAGQVLALADENGTLLKVYASNHILDSLRDIRFIEGANWSEEVTGTNGTGTALKIRQPVQIFGPEHFCKSWHSWVCSAVPIFDRRTGQLLGVLEASTCGAVGHSYTLVAVKAMVTAIENQIEKLGWIREQRIIDQYNEIASRHISDGILAIDARSRIIRLNPSGARLLGIDPEMTCDLSISDILEPQYASHILGSSEEIEGVKEVKACLSNTEKEYLFSCHPVVVGGKKVGSVLVLVFAHGKTRAQKNQSLRQADVKYTFEDLIGRSPNFLETLRIARIAAQNSFPVLISGETGTGKEMVAESIHHASSRHHHPFIAVNCAAIPSELMASEFFGYVEGAFTGAKRSGNPGKFELANGGTIFLDEISELSLTAQAALLRVLQELEITRVGSGSIIPLDVRVIAATNSNLHRKVEEKTFRSDLLHRLDVLSLTMPPLRERREDIEELANSFLILAGTQLQKRELKIEKTVIDCLLTYNWPGNVRELNNVIQRAAALASDSLITLRELPGHLTQGFSAFRKTKQRAPLLQEQEKSLILQLLHESHNNLSITASRLGLGRTTLYRKRKKYDIQRFWKSQ